MIIDLRSSSVSRDRKSADLHTGALPTTESQWKALVDADRSGAVQMLVRLAPHLPDSLRPYAIAYTYNHVAYPCRELPPAEWVTLMRGVGYMINGVPALNLRPTRPVRLFRACPPRVGAWDFLDRRPALRRDVPMDAARRRRQTRLPRARLGQTRRIHGQPSVHHHRAARRPSRHAAHQHQHRSRLAAQQQPVRGVVKRRRTSRTSRLPRDRSRILRGPLAPQDQPGRSIHPPTVALRAHSDEEGTVIGDGDGWVRCGQGHRHWGRYGAAGLLLVRRRTNQTKVLMQKRARSTESGTWSIPGGARASYETPLQAAMREAGEEAGIHSDDVRVAGIWRDDHGGWTYITALATPLTDCILTPNAESAELRWVKVCDVQLLPLHPDFARTWPIRAGSINRLVDGRHSHD